MKNALSLNAGRARNQAGFSLIELSVAMVISLFLLGGLFMMQQSTRKTSTQQTQLAQLQDNQRLAVTIMTDVIQTAGFFPRPTVNTLVTALPNVAVAPNYVFAAGQGVFAPNATNPDSIAVQYMSEGSVNDNMIMCNGQQTPNAAPGIAYINRFSLDKTDPNNPQLVCTVSTNIGGAIAQLTNPPVVLVDGVDNLQLLYGVATSGINGTSVDTYMTAAQVTAANRWADVSSVKVTLTFLNPLFGQPGYTAAAQRTVTFSRVISIMNRANG